MADKTVPELGALTSLADTDLMVVWSIVDSALRKMEASVLVDLILSAAAPTFLSQANNLADVDNVPSARGNLGLGDSATKNTGTAAGTVAAGNDARFSTVPDGYVTPQKLSTGGPSWDAAGNTNVPSLSVNGGLFAGAGGDIWVVKVGTQTYFKFSNSGGAYWVYDLTTGITNLYANFTNVLSIDLSGDAIFKGSVTQNGVPV